MFIETFAVFAIILTIVGGYAYMQKLYNQFDQINK